MTTWHKPSLDAGEKLAEAGREHRRAELARLYTRLLWLNERLGYLVPRYIDLRLAGIFATPNPGSRGAD